MKIFGLTILLAVFIAIPSTAQVTWGMRGGLAYSSLIQKTDNNYLSKVVRGLIGSTAFGVLNVMNEQLLSFFSFKLLSVNFYDYVHLSFSI